jgi:two-component system, response regulator PdtaR
MPAKILIVEDELLIAVEMEAIVEEHGHSAVGIATNKTEAHTIAARARPDVALVDINLSDGPTGPEIGLELARSGTTVIFVTANPRLAIADTSGIIGVVEKPLLGDSIEDVVRYAVARRAGISCPPPSNLRAFG